MNMTCTHDSEKVESTLFVNVRKRRHRRDSFSLSEDRAEAPQLRDFEPEWDSDSFC